MPPTAAPCEQLNGLFLPTQSALFREGSFISGPYCHGLIRPRFKGARCEMTQIAGPSGAPRALCDRHPLQTEPPPGTAPILLSPPSAGPPRAWPASGALFTLDPTGLSPEVPGGRSPRWEGAAPAERGAARTSRPSPMSAPRRAVSGCPWNHLLRVWQLQAGKGQGWLPRPAWALPEQGNGGRGRCQQGGDRAGMEPGRRDRDGKHGTRSIQAAPES